MQQLNVMLPDKEDIYRWLSEAKEEIKLEVKQELANEFKPKCNYITRSEMAKRLNISLVALHNRTEQGLPSIKVGKRRLYDPEKVEQYLNEKNQQ